MKEDAQLHNESWSKAIYNLTKLFIGYRNLNEANEREKLRSKFYNEFRRLSVVAAMKSMSSQWQGDRFQDAEDFASLSLVTLLRQEKQKRGVFQKAHWPTKKLQGYLSQSIWIGVKSRIRDEFKKQNKVISTDGKEFGTNADTIDQKASHVALEIDLRRALAKVRSHEEKIYRLNGGFIPLDALLNDQVAGVVLRNIPKRTWQRYIQESRERLVKELGR